jgi:hypothetical protein
MLRRPRRCTRRVHYTEDDNDVSSHDTELESADNVSELEEDKNESDGLQKSDALSDLEDQDGYMDKLTDVRLMTSDSGSKDDEDAWDSDCLLTDEKPKEYSKEISTKPPAGSLDHGKDGEIMSTEKETISPNDLPSLTAGLGLRSPTYWRRWYPPRETALEQVTTGTEEEDPIIWHADEIEVWVNEETGPRQIVYHPRNDSKSVASSGQNMHASTQSLG